MGSKREPLGEKGNPVRPSAHTPSWLEQPRPDESLQPKMSAAAELDVKNRGVREAKVLGQKRRSLGQMWEWMVRSDRGLWS